MLRASRPGTTVAQRCSPLAILAFVGCALAPPRARPARTAPSRTSAARAVDVASEARDASAAAATASSPFDALPGWRADRTAEALPAWRRTCARLLHAAETERIGRSGDAGTVADWAPACRALPSEGADDATARSYFERWFAPERVGGDDEPGLFTGYYEPELHGSRTRHGRFTVPLYPRPPDLLSPDGRGPSRAPRTGRRVHGRMRPYFTRAQITAGALARKCTPLVWVDDATDAFFLEIQGSGRVVLDDGATLQLNYAAHNGHPYVPVGRVLIARGALERSAVSLQSIRAWMHANPRRARGVMNQNPSYVFFRVSEVEGAHGAAGVVLTPGRSLAVDPRHVPLGVPVFLDLAPLEGVGAIQRLLVAQDTGGAIRGLVRGDVFWGTGPEAYDRAGRMHQAGRYWLLLPRSVPRVRSAAPRTTGHAAIASERVDAGSAVSDAGSTHPEDAPVLASSPPGAGAPGP